MKPADLAHALRSGQKVFGTLTVSTSPRLPDVLKGSGVDFVFIDTEHTAIDRIPLSWMCQTYNALGIAPIVRIPAPDPYAATMVLDGGAAGVIAPYVETAQQVRDLVGAVKFRPIRGKRLDDMLAGGAIEPELDQYMKSSAANRLVIVNTESVPAIKALEEIVRVPGLDSVLIGPHDLTCSLGIPEQWENPKFLAACEKIFRTARAAGVGAGIHYWGGVEQQVQMFELGANMLVHSADYMLFRKHLRLELDEIKRRLGIESDSTAGIASI
ncbi:MAG: aldolase/citrate lyase family protein [Pirellulales bacterium]